MSTLGGQRRQLSPVLVELIAPLTPLSLAFLPYVRKPVRAEGRAAQGAVGLPLSQHPVAATQLRKLGIQPLILDLQPLDGPHRRIELCTLRQHALALPDNAVLTLRAVLERCLRRPTALCPRAQLALRAVPQPVRLRGQPVRLLCNGILQLHRTSLKGRVLLLGLTQRSKALLPLSDQPPGPVEYLDAPCQHVAVPSRPVPRLCGLSLQPLSLGSALSDGLSQPVRFLLHPLQRGHTSFQRRLLCPCDPQKWRQPFQHPPSVVQRLLDFRSIGQLPLRGFAVHLVPEQLRVELADTLLGAVLQPLVQREAEDVGEGLLALGRLAGGEAVRLALQHECAVHKCVVAHAEQALHLRLSLRDGALRQRPITVAGCGLQVHHAGRASSAAAPGVLPHNAIRSLPCRKCEGHLHVGLALVHELIGRGPASAVAPAPGPAPQRPRDRVEQRRLAVAVVAGEAANVNVAQVELRVALVAEEVVQAQVQWDHGARSLRLVVGES